MRDFEEAIEDWKLIELQTDAAILLQDLPLLKYAALWRASVVDRISNYVLGERWADLWECVSINHALLADMADDTENRARFQVRRLIEMKLIYPDGTRHELATRAVIKFMTDRLI